MRKTLFQSFLILLVSAGLTLLLERLANQHVQNRDELQVREQIVQVQQNLQRTMDRIITDNRTLAEQLASIPEAFQPPYPTDALQNIRVTAPQLSYTLAKDFKIIQAIPFKGNEGILGMDYLMSPDDIRSARAAFKSRNTSVTHVKRLRQTNQPGLIVRTLVHSGPGSTEMLSSILDFQQLLEVSGYRPEHNYSLLIGQSAPGASVEVLLGHQEVYAQQPLGPKVEFPGGIKWELRGHLHTPSFSLQRALGDWIRLSGALVTVLTLLALLKRRGLLNGLTSKHQRITLRFALLLFTLLPIAVLILLFEMLYFGSLQRTALRLQENHIQALGRQASTELQNFLEIPRQAAFNTELFHRGILHPQEAERMLGFFATQLRIQPRLTFMSVVTPEGEFYAASRPPSGLDRTLRMQWATLATNREMQIHWVTDRNEASTNFVRGNSGFDGREFPWYQSARVSPGLQWYPPYAYLTKDSLGQYREFGFGISLPIFDPDDIFLGVLAADISLSQLSDILNNLALDKDTRLILTEPDGQLLAMSGNQSILHRKDGQLQRMQLSELQLPGLSGIAPALNTTDSPQGLQQLARTPDSTPHLLDWRTFRVPDGPELRLITLMPIHDPEGRGLHSMWRDALYLGWLTLLCGTLVTLFASTWLARPLLSLERWARHLQKGDWDAEVPKVYSIREVVSLAQSLKAMAHQLRSHTSSLEQQIERRTRELKQANHRLERLSMTDGLTGLANRRCLDQHSETLWQQALHNGSAFAILMLDIDWFKHYNDHYGHQQGDLALREVAQRVASMARRSNDLAARYGGEEFVLLLDNTETEAALELAERLRAEIENQNIAHDCSPLKHITVSIGVAVFKPEQPASSLDELYLLADAALYKAKATGRNQVAISY